MGSTKIYATLFFVIPFIILAFAFLVVLEVIDRSADMVGEWICEIIQAEK